MATSTTAGSLKKAISFFSGAEMPARVWGRKYRLRDRADNFLEDDPLQTFCRMADAVGAPPDSTLRRNLVDRRFIPAGRILFALGNPYFSACLKNCFVLIPADDSLEAIADLRKEMARTYSMGGGVGIDISRLRPAGSPVNNAAITSSGSVSFADGFSHLTGEIGQNGRRGALMISLSVDHPDVRRFITIKDDFPTDLADKLRNKLPRKIFKRLVEEVIEPRRNCGNANMSLRVTDRFMQAVKDRRPHVARFVMDDGEIIEEVFDARQLFHEIAEHAWAHGCPGVLFWDTMERWDNRNYLDSRWHIVGVNPCGEMALSDGGSCLHGDTIISTTEGLRKIKDFDRGRIATASGRLAAAHDARPDYGVSVVQDAVAFKTSDSRRILRVVVDAGMTVRATPDHIFMTDVGEVRADQLIERGARVKWMDSSPISTPVRFSEDTEIPTMLGWMHGDGWMTESSVGISFNKEDGDFEIKDQLLATYFRLFGERKPLRDDGVSYQVQTESKRAFGVAEDYGVYLAKATDRRLPEKFYHLSANQQLAFLAGLFTADGWVEGKSNRVIGYSTSSARLVEDLKAVLGALGIQTRHYTTTFDGGRNDQHKLNITKASARKFMSLIGFLTEAKTRAFNWSGPEYSDKAWLPVTRVEEEAEEVSVYDFTVETTHMGFANGVLVHNCNLGAINLARFTTNPYTERAEFDWNAYNQAIRDGVDFLDGVNDIELKEGRAPLKKQAECTEALRQIGLGVMGYGDLLLQHQIPYGSDEALEFTDRIFRTLRDIAYSQSIARAKKYGPFPAFDWEKIKRSPFIQSLPVEIQRGIEKHGLRNSNLLSIAPTGTIAIMGETTGSIEPEFAFQLTRSVMLGNGQRTKFTFLTPTAQRIAKALGKSVPQGEIEGPVDMSWLPDWAVASHQIDPKRRARVQGLIQKYVDVSISSTVNLPESATVEDVVDVYWEAYNAGCKGITVYREGSREGILQTLSEEDRLDFPINAPLQVNSRRISFKGEHGHQRILINVGDYRPGVPCEVSIIHGKSGTEVSSYASALGILISIALQNGVPPSRIARSLEGINAGWAARLRLDGHGKKPTLVQSVPDAVAAVLQKFYGSGIYEKGVLGQPLNGETNIVGWELSADERKAARNCPQCQKQSYIPDAGCWKCINPACEHDGACG